jgi:hypothetical protein
MIILRSSYEAGNTIYAECYVGNLKERHHLEYLDAKRKIILKGVFNISMRTEYRVKRRDFVNTVMNLLLS